MEIAMRSENRKFRREISQEKKEMTVYEGHDEAFEEAGRIYAGENYEGILRALEPVMKREPKNEKANFLAAMARAHISVAVEDFVEARRDLQRALEIDPESAEVER